MKGPVLLGTHTLTTEHFFFIFMKKSLFCFVSWCTKQNKILVTAYRIPHVRRKKKKKKSLTHPQKAAPVRCLRNYCLQAEAHVHTSSFRTKTTLRGLCFYDSCKDAGKKMLRVATVLAPQAHDNRRRVGGTQKGLEQHDERGCFHLPRQLPSWPSDGFQKPIDKISPPHPRPPRPPPPTRDAQQTTTQLGVA